MCVCVCVSSHGCVLPSLIHGGEEGEGEIERRKLEIADNETINIFSLASGHLYERFLRSELINNCLGKKTSVQSDKYNSQQHIKNDSHDRKQTKCISKMSMIILVISCGSES